MYYTLVQKCDMCPSPLACRYVIQRMLNIRTSHLVLRGAGSGLSTLYFPKDLSDIYRDNKVPPEGLA